MGKRIRRADRHTLLQALKALKGDLKRVCIGELGGVIEDLDAQQRDERHDGCWWSDAGLLVDSNCKHEASWMQSRAGFDGLARRVLAGQQ